MTRQDISSFIVYLNMSSACKKCGRNAGKSIEAVESYQICPHLSKLLLRKALEYRVARVMTSVVDQSLSQSLSETVFQPPRLF
jgi:hypothetical protein